MRARSRISLIVIATLTIMVLVKILLPKPINWMESFEKDDVIPYGETLLFTLLPEMFPGDSIRVMTETPYQELSHDTISSPKNLLYLSSRFTPDETSLAELLRSVRSGNTAFIAAKYFSSAFRDSIGLSTTSVWYDTVETRFTNDALSRTQYSLRADRTLSCFDSIPQENVTVLGQLVGRLDTSNVDRELHIVANYIRVRLGQGQLLLHCDPILFTNYFLSNDTLRPYAFQALSYLPPQATWWDEYYKPGRRDESSEFRFIFTDRRLSAAYYIVITGLVLLVVFHTKRRQRVIPVIEEPKNATLDFVSTVGALYYLHRDSTAIIERKVRMLYDFLRTKFYCSEVRHDSTTHERISAKSGIELTDVVQYFTTIENIRSKRVHVDADVMALHRVIEEFRNRCTTKS